MKPLVLTLKAFGPFAGEQRVDFTRTGTNPFLLINGPTGAGKTSLLDGLCFALYGKASGEAREKQNDKFLRSQLARPEDECSVSLSFQVGERRFLIERKPTQDVHSRGKSVERKHRVEFCELDAHGVVLGERLSKVGEVDERVEDLVGFTCEQFRQVMVLPQGEFRRLLLAKSDEKEKILQKLFGAAKYKLVEEALKRRRGELERLLTELRTGMEAILSAKGATGVDELETLLAGLAGQRQEREDELVAARLRLAQAQATAAQAQAVEKDFLEQAHAGQALQGLLAALPGVEEQERRTERAFKALEHADLEAAIIQGEADAKARETALQRLDADIKTLSDRREAAQTALALAQAKRAKTPEHAAEQERLTAQLKLLQERDTARQQVEQVQAREATARAGAQQATTQATLADERLAALTAQIEALSLLAGDSARLDLDISRLASLAEQRGQLDRLLGQRAAAQTALVAAEERQAAHETELAQARQQRQEAQQALLAGQAAHLAATLAEGQPCPVCGATDHPQPAPRAADQPTERDLAEAESRVLAQEQALAAARKQAEAARTTLAGLDSGLTHLREALGAEAETPVAELAQRLAAVQADKARAAEQAGHLQQCRQQREALAASRQELHTRQAAVEQELNAAAAALASATALLKRAQAGAGGAEAVSVQVRLDELARLIPAAEQAFQTAQKALNELDAGLRTRQGEQSALKQTAQDAAAKLSEQRETFERRLLIDGFHTRQEYQEAKLPRPRAETLRQEAAKFREALAAGRDRQTRAQTACAGKTRPDMAVLDQAQQAAAAVVDRLNHELGELGTQREGILEALNAIGEKAGRTRELEAQYRVAGRLAELAGGQNQYRMTLQRYVLAALFEEVARAASERLSRMSRGRYHLVRADVARDGRSTGGLDLDVTDAHTGETRPASTLSGGESFLASLALALGLSDVVMAQQGGRRLDCIFIDEGFGSLDGETLEYALNTLMELHSAGRLIGIISHVAELKERIDARIDVLPGKSGSSIQQVNC
jgi:DNA repair protein SbcC/Rad50